MINAIVCHRAPVAHDPTGEGSVERTLEARTAREAPGRRRSPVASGAQEHAVTRATGLARVRAYGELTKPGITLFLVLFAVVGAVVAGGAAVSPVRLVLLVLAAAASVGGAAALNQVREADIDARMRRTAGRPVPSGRLESASARAFAIALSVSGLAISALFLPWLTTLVLALGHAGYVLVYTPMKRRSALCTPIGALPGALPALAGCTAGGVVPGPAELAFFATLVLWQLPHFMAIGWLCRDQYAAAGFRVLPALDPDGWRTGVWTLVPAVLLVPVSAVPLGLAGSAAPVGTAAVLAAAVLGTGYALGAARFLLHREAGEARTLFRFSLLYVPAYLAIVLIAVAA